MPRALPAALTTTMDSGAYEPYIRVVINEDPIEAGQETIEPLAFTLEALRATAKIPSPTSITDPSYFRIVRGALISGTPSTISSIWFKINKREFDGKFVTLTGEPLQRGYKSVAMDSTYEDVIDAALIVPAAGINIVANYEGTAAWKAYQFYPAGRNIILSPYKKLFTILQQKYLVFATEDGWDGAANNMRFFVSTEVPAVDYTVEDPLFNYETGQELRKLIARDEASTIRTNGSSDSLLHNLGFLHSTASLPTNTANNNPKSRTSHIPVHLKYRTGDRVTFTRNGIGVGITTRIKVTEVLDLQATPAWYQVLDVLQWYGSTEGGAMPSTIEAAAPYTPLATGSFAGILDSTDNNIQAAMETIDDHSHGSSAPATTALDDFQMGDGAGAWITKTLAQAVTRIRTILDAIYSDAAHTHEVDQRADMWLDSEGNPAAIGAAADGTSIYGARRDHVHAITNGEAVLSPSFGITGTAGTYQDTGLAITLPTAGTYLVIADTRATVKGNAGTLWWITVKLYNSTDAADVANSERLIVLTGTTAVILENTAVISAIITIAASKVIKLYAFRNGQTSPSWTNATIDSDVNGRTSMRYIKIG